MTNEITDQNLRDIMPNLPAAKRQLYLPHLNDAMREFEVATYRWLTTNLRFHADTFLCTTGFNSLYFWTGQEPPAPIMIGLSLIHI